MNQQEIIDVIPADLKAAPLPIQTASYIPVDHVKLISAIYNYLHHAGYQVDGAKFNSAAQGRKMVGTFNLNKGNDEFGQTMVFRNSYDKSMSIGVGSGTVVFACNNGIISAEMLSLRKHTTNVKEDFQVIMQHQIEHLDEVFQKNIEEMEILKQRQIKRTDINEIVGSMFLEHKVLTTTQMNIVRKEIEYSEHFKMLGKDGNMSLFNMYQNITESLKISHPTNYTSDHVKTHEVLMEYA